MRRRAFVTGLCGGGAAVKEKVELAPVEATAAADEVIE